MQPTYFLSDLHLPQGDSELRSCFREFLDVRARSAAAVYILGDLFEYWVGDDFGIDTYYEEMTALRALHHAGVPVYFQHGNRDFLVGREFAELAELSLIDEEHFLHLGGEKVLLAHGDQYCTDDVSYQRWRNFSRNPEIQMLFQWLPRRLRERIGLGVRNKSSEQRTVKADSIMDVNDNAIRRCFADTGVDRIIHGHTHRPNEHYYKTNGQRRVRMVLADWRADRMEVLRFDESGYRRVPLNESSSD